MHERLFKQRSFDDSVLAKFTNKTNQSFNDFLAQFDYKNDRKSVYVPLKSIAFTFYFYFK